MLREYKNLTPRPEIDTDGISFSLIPTTTKGNAKTTIGALEDAGFTCIINGTHVSVVPPGGVSALDDWSASYNNAETNPHRYTLLLYELTW